MFFKNKKTPPCTSMLKNKDEVNVIASLLINILKTEKIQFLFLKGKIGSGKTFLVKEIAKFFNEHSTIISPTFNHMFVYDNFVHIDAYNMKSKTLESFEDYFEDKIVIIEWPEMLNFSENALQVEITYVNEKTRKYNICWI